MYLGKTKFFKISDYTTIHKVYYKLFVQKGYCKYISYYG